MYLHLYTAVAMEITNVRVATEISTLAFAIGYKSDQIGKEITADQIHTNHQLDTNSLASPTLSRLAHRVTGNQRVNYGINMETEHIFVIPTYSSAVRKHMEHARMFYT